MKAIQSIFSNSAIKENWLFGRLKQADNLDSNDIYNFLEVTERLKYSKERKPAERIKEAELALKALQEKGKNKKDALRNLAEIFRVKKNQMLMLLLCTNSVVKVRQRFPFSSIKKSQELEILFEGIILLMYKACINKDPLKCIFDIKKIVLEKLKNTYKSKKEYWVIFEYIIDLTCFVDVVNFDYSTYVNFCNTVFGKENDFHFRYAKGVKKDFISKVAFTLCLDNESGAIRHTEFFAGDFKYILLELLIECYLEKGFYQFLPLLIKKHLDDLQASPREILKHCVSVGDDKPHMMRLGRAHLLDYLYELSASEDLLSSELEKSKKSYNNTTKNKRVNDSREFISMVKNQYITLQTAYFALASPFYGYAIFNPLKQAGRKNLKDWFAVLERKVDDQNTNLYIGMNKGEHFFRLDNFVKTFCGMAPLYLYERYGFDKEYIVSTLNQIIDEDLDVDKSLVLKKISKVAVTLPINKRLSAYRCVSEWFQELYRYEDDEAGKNIKKAPLIVFDQSEDSIFQENEEYLKIVAKAFMGAYIQVSLADIFALVERINKAISKKLNRKVDVSDWYYETLPTGKLVVGYGRCRNMGFHLGPFFRVAYLKEDCRVSDPGRLIETLSDDDISNIFAAVINGSESVWMFEDDVTPMPGFAVSVLVHMTDSEKVITKCYGRDSVNLQQSESPYAGLYPFVHEAFSPAIAMALFKHSSFCFPCAVGGEESHNDSLSEGLGLAYTTYTVQQSTMRNPLLEIDLNGSQLTRDDMQKLLFARSLKQDVHLGMHDLWLIVFDAILRKKKTKTFSEFYKDLKSKNNDVKSIKEVFKYLLKTRFKIQKESISLISDVDELRNLFPKYFQSLVEKYDNSEEKTQSEITNGAVLAKRYKDTAEGVIAHFLDKKKLNGIRGFLKLFDEKEIKDTKKYSQKLKELKNNNQDFLKEVFNDKEMPREQWNIAIIFAEWLYECFDKLSLGGMFDDMADFVSFADQGGEEVKKG